MAGKNNKSIVTDKELRKKVAIQLARKINEILKRMNPEIKEDELCKEEDFIKRAESDEYVKLREKGLLASSLKETLIKNNKNAPTGRVDGEPVTSRFTYLYGSDGSTVDDYKINRKIKISSLNKYILDKKTNDFCIDTLNADPIKFASMTEEEAIENYINDFKTYEKGFVLKDTTGTSKIENDILANITERNLPLFQSSPALNIAELYSNPLFLLIPDTFDFSIFYTCFKEINQTILEVDKDIIEFDDVISVDPNRQTNNNAYKYTSCKQSVELGQRDAKEIKKLCDAKLIDKGFPFKYVFKDSKGNILRIDKVSEHIKDGKLVDGVTREEIPAKELETLEKYNKVTNYRGLFEQIASDYLNYQVIDFVKEDQTLLDTMDEFLEKYEDFKENHKKEEDIDKEFSAYENFYLENKELIEHIDAVTELTESKFQKEFDDYYNKEREEVSKNNKEMQEYLSVLDDEIELEGKAKNKEAAKEKVKSLVKLNYANLAKKGETSSNYYSNLKNNEENEISNKFKELSESSFKDNNEVSKAIKNYSKPLDREKIKNDVALIHTINQKDKEYQNRWFITKAWYKKSHQKMMDQKENIINKLEEFGVGKISIKNLRDGIPDLGITISDVVHKVERFRINNNIKIDKLYEKYIVDPKMNMEKLDRRLERYQESKEKTLNAISRMESIFKDNIKENNPSVDTDNITKDDINNYIENKASIKEKEAYIKLQGEYEAVNEKVDSLNKKIEETKDNYSKGRLKNNEKDLENKIKDSLSNNKEKTVNKTKETEPELTNNKELKVKGK